MTLFFLSCFICFALGYFLGQVAQIQDRIVDNFFPAARITLRNLQAEAASIELRRKEIAEADLQVNALNRKIDYAVQQRDELQSQLDSVQSDEARRMLRYHAEQLSAWLEADGAAKLISRDREVILKDAN